MDENNLYKGFQHTYIIWYSIVHCKMEAYKINTSIAQLYILKNLEVFKSVFTNPKSIKNCKSHMIKIVVCGYQLPYFNYGFKSSIVNIYCKNGFLDLIIENFDVWYANQDHLDFYNTNRDKEKINADFLSLNDFFCIS